MNYTGKIKIKSKLPPCIACGFLILGLLFSAFSLMEVNSVNAQSTGYETLMNKCSTTYGACKLICANFESATENIDSAEGYDRLETIALDKLNECIKKINSAKKSEKASTFTEPAPDTSVDQNLNKGINHNQCSNSQSQYGEHWPSNKKIL